MVRVMTLSLSELASDAGSFLYLDGESGGGEALADQPSWNELFELRRYLRLGLADLVADRRTGSEPVGVAPLRLTKGRVRTAAICPAQVLAEIDPFGVNFNIAVGIVCDAAAGILALHPGFRPESTDLSGTGSGARGWFETLCPSLQQERPHLIEFVDQLGHSDRADFDHVVDDLCGVLPDLLGDLRPHRPTVHHRIAHVPVPGVHVTGEIDIACDFSIEGVARGRILAEVKSGRFSPRISDELAHYGLITTLQQLPGDPDDHADNQAGDGEPAQTPAGRDQPPRMVVGCSISLGDLAVTPMNLSLEVLQTSARRLLDTTKGLLAIDETMRGGGRPPTNPGDHCRWCRRVAACGDAPDLVMAELNESLRPLEPLRFDPDFDDGAINDSFDRAAADDPEAEVS